MLDVCERLVPREVLLLILYRLDFRGAMKSKAIQPIYSVKIA